MRDKPKPKDGYTCKKNEVACFVKTSYEIANFLAGLEENGNDVVNWSGQISTPRHCNEKLRTKVIHCYRKHPTKTLLCSKFINEFQKSVKKV